jgi:hypothetical protein
MLVTALYQSINKRKECIQFTQKSKVTKINPKMLYSTFISAIKNILKRTYRNLQFQNFPRENHRLKGRGPNDLIRPWYV